jgi:hypothetical protein
MEGGVSVMTELATNMTAVVGLCTDLLGLLATFPLNILVVGLAGGVAFRLIRGAKKVAG